MPRPISGMPCSRRILDQADDVLGVPGRDDPQRLHLVEAGVGGVEEAGDVVELHVAPEQAAKVAGDAAASAPARPRPPAGTPLAAEVLACHFRGITGSSRCDGYSALW